MIKQSLYPEFGVLLVDDEASFLRSLSMTLERNGGINNLHRCDDSRQVMDLLTQQQLKQHPIGLVLLDLTMPHLSGQQLLQMINEQHPEITVIIISGLNQVESAVECLKLGAFDYFVKTTEEGRLLEGIKRAIRMQEMQLENQALTRRMMSNSLEHPEAFDNIVTRSPQMRAIFQYLESVARSSQPLLICGESGTGKELIAQAAHKLSQRSGALVTVNVAGLDDNVFADTLFGHQRGAFTGADRARPGLIEEAAGGTLFLDEIGDMPADTQTRLLRVLADGEFYRVGGHTPVQVDVRIIAATHQDLENLVQEGRFREDLFHRLNVIRVHLPKLSERREDIPRLADFFLSKAAKELEVEPKILLQSTVDYMQQLSWPGNVRQLENTCRWITVMASGREVHLDDLPPELMEQKQSEQATGSRWQSALNNWADQALAQGQKGILDTAVPEFEKVMIEVALKHTAGRRRDAAELLGWGRNTLTRKIKELNLETASEDED